jgi:hypothetical protein
VAQSIGDEVLQRLLEAVGISPESICAGADLGGKLDVTCGGFTLVTRTNAFEQRRDGDDVVTKRDTTGLQLRNIEQVTNDALEPVGFVFDDSKVASPCLRVEPDVLHRQGLDVASHRRQRCHQLMVRTSVVTAVVLFGTRHAVIACSWRPNDRAQRHQ